MTKSIQSWLAGLCFLWVGCAAFPQRAEQAILTADEAVSPEVLEEYLENHPFGRHRDPVSFRLAMLYLSPESPPYDPGRARTLLWQLAGSSQTSFRDGARQVLALLTEVERLRGETAWGAETLERLRQDTMRLRGVAELAEHQAAEKNRSVSLLEEELEKLRGKLWLVRREKASQEEEMEQLARELRELKLIDTGQAP